MEPRFDFDPNALKTTATKKDGKYILSGTKCNVPFAAESDWILVYASFEGQCQGFLLPKGTPGLTVKEREKNMGMRAFPMYAVELQECEAAALAAFGRRRRMRLPAPPELFAHSAVGNGGRRCPRGL